MSLVEAENPRISAGYSRSKAAKLPSYFDYCDPTATFYRSHLPEKNQPNAQPIVATILSRFFGAVLRVSKRCQKGNGNRSLIKLQRNQVMNADASGA